VRIIQLVNQIVFVIGLLVVSSVADAGDPVRYYMLRFQSLANPYLGEGFDPTDPESKRIKPTSLEFQTEKRREDAQRWEVDVSEITTNRSSTKTSDSDANFGLKEYLTTKTGSGTYSELVEQNSVFLVRAVAICETQRVVKPQLKPEVLSMSKDDFKINFGPSFVSKIDRGAYVFLVYVFSSVDQTERTKFQASLTATFGGASGGASLNEELKSRQVSTKYTLFTIQDGGSSVGPALVTNLASLKDHLKELSKGVNDAPAVVSFEVSNYLSEVPGFPHRWDDIGFGKTIIRVDE
jgi:hypothetical protein